MRRKKNELTKQETIFFKEYIKSSNMLKALNVAYPTTVNWNKNCQYVQANKILNNPIMNLKIKEHNEREAEALKNSTTLNKRKILDEIIELQTNAKNEKGQAMINLQALKLLAQISKLLDNSPQINNNIVVNNQNINQISDFLDL
jgi:hypothetical protein